jgi:hypothetical protein
LKLLLDHAIVLVRDLRAAEAVLIDAGIVLGRSGEHPGLGTHNRLVLFEQGPYLELLAVHTPQPDNAAYRALLQDRASALGLALHSADLQATRARLLAAGRPVGDVLHAARPMPDGGVARFSLLRLAPGGVPADFAFFCQHHTPERVWEAASQPANPHGLRALQPGSAAPALDAVLGAEHAVTPGCGAVAVDVLPPARHGLATLRWADGARLVIGHEALSYSPGTP